MKFTWGGMVNDGFLAVPQAFLKRYQAMGLEMDEAMLILHILGYCWRDGSNPYPKVERLVAETGKSEASIRAMLRSLRQKGFLKTTNRRGRSNEYDFKPLFEALGAVGYLNRTEVEDAAGEVGPDVKLAPAPARLSESRRSDLQESDSRMNNKHRNPESTSADVPLADANMDLPPSRPAKPSWKDEMELRLDATRKSTALATERSAERRAAAAERKANEGFVSKPKPANTKDWRNLPKELWTVATFESLWRSLYDEYMTEVPVGPVTQKDRSLAKGMLTGYGPDLVRDALTDLFKRWPEHRSRMGVTGYPSVGMVFGYRNSIFPVFAAPVPAEQTKPKWGSHPDNANRRAAKDGSVETF